MKELILSFLVNVCYFINRIVPKDNERLFFYSFPDYSDNARAIYEELREENKMYKVTWAVHDVKKYKTVIDGATVVRHKSIKSLIMYCRSKYIFRTHSLWGNKYVIGKQIMYVAWHGMPLKDMMGEKPTQTKCTFLNMTSHFFDNQMYGAVAIPEGDNPAHGLARNDALLHNTDILKYLKLDGFNKVYLWMPTFRKSIQSYHIEGKKYEYGIPLVDTETLKKIDVILQKHNNVLILKLHPLSQDIPGYLGLKNIINLKDEEFNSKYVLYDLVAQADVLLTDYSSVYIDFLLTNMPIWFVYDDIQEYRSSRGFAFEPAEEYMPGPHICSSEKLIEYFDDKYEDVYLSKRIEVKRKFHDYGGANSSKRIIEFLRL